MTRSLPRPFRRAAERHVVGGDPAVEHANVTLSIATPPSNSRTSRYAAEPNDRSGQRLILGFDRSSERVEGERTSQTQSGANSNAAASGSSGIRSRRQPAMSGTKDVTVQMEFGLSQNDPSALSPLSSTAHRPRRGRHRARGHTKRARRCRRARGGRRAHEWGRHGRHCARRGYARCRGPRCGRTWLWRRGPERWWRPERHPYAERTPLRHLRKRRYPLCGGVQCRSNPVERL
jgi:hypothetical protein